MKKIFIATLLLILPLLSGCVGLKEVYEKLVEFFKKPIQYKWVVKVDREESFKWLDMINADLAKVSSYPFFIKDGTKYLHIYIEVNFSNPLGIKGLSQGKLNLTIVTPIKNVSKSYCTTAKSKTYNDFIYFANPEEGEWELVIKLIGYGKYKIFVEAYERI